MNKKKLLPMLAALTLVGAIAVGATLAYFTDSEEAVNVVTMGNVDVDLTEPGFDKEDGKEDNTVTNITPGEEIKKDPTITVKEGSEDAYVRATIKIEGLDAQQTADLMAGITVNKGWVLSADADAEGNQYYYFQNALKAGEAACLFDTVVIPEKWGNEMADATFEIIVKGEAIQADNFEPTRDAAGNIVAWQYSDGSNITVENYVAPSVSAGDAQ